jgi:chemotaxis protein histidine kinase CheA
MNMNIEIVEELNTQFNASFVVTDLLAKTLENYAKNLASQCIKECAIRHSFDAEEEIRILGLENLTLVRKLMAKKSESKDSKKSKKSKETKEKKSSFPMPFMPSTVDQFGCQGLAFNRGLFTQCIKTSMKNGSFCKGCQSEADKNASGCPDCGTIEQRLATGLYEFKDPKGRSPVSYLKVLEKLKLTQEQSLEEAIKLNIEVSEEHFEVVEKAKKSKKTDSSRGRPKKPSLAIEADNVTDLFAKLTSEEEEECDLEVSEKPVKVSKKSKLSDEEKAAKKEALEAERLAKKEERDAKLALEKAEREEKRKADLEAKKLEREAKVAQEKAEREEKRAQEKAERELKKAQEKAAKESEKSTKSKKTAKTEPKVEEPKVEAPAKVSVTRIQVDGKSYLKSSANILYDPSTKEEVGLWDPETKTIKELPEDDEEEEEEGYESD